MSEGGIQLLLRAFEIRALFSRGLFLVLFLRGLVLDILRFLRLPTSEVFFCFVFVAFSYLRTVVAFAMADSSSAIAFINSAIFQSALRSMPATHQFLMPTVVVGGALYKLG